MGGATAAGGVTSTLVTSNSGGASTSVTMVSGGVLGSGGATGTAITIPTGGATSTGGATAVVTTSTGGAPTSTGGSTSIATSSTGGTSAPASTIAPREPTTHRAQASSCLGVNSPPEPVNTGTSCKKHADCTAGVNGKCVNGIGMAWSITWCVYDQCATDENCTAGKVCFCTSTSAARCLSVGNCRTDADCGTGPYAYCSASMGMDCGGIHSVDGYHCHTPQDSCIDNSDCTGNQYCDFNDYEGRWKCTAPNMTCVIG